MTDLDRVTAYLRRTLWPDRPGFEYSDAMAEEIDEKCRTMAAEILALLATGPG